MSNQSKDANCWAIVPAAGVGRRMQADRPKQYLPLAASTVLEQTLLRLWDSGVFKAIVVSISVEDEYWPTLAVAKNDWIVQADGGEQRADSVLSGLKALEDLADPADWVFVHDAARPCLTSADIHELKRQINNDPVGGILALPVHDTLKRADQSRIVNTLDRSTIWRALTPQAFRLGMLKQALSDASRQAITVTDEASAVEAMGLQPLLVEGRADNIKITRPEDLALARFYLEQRMIRVGTGYDVHAFKNTGRLVLGGVDIAYEKGMEAHSDGDVVLHALCDALLGAAALGDIGKHFPDTDHSFKGIDSRVLLRHVITLLVDQGFEVSNLDMTIIAQQPKLAGYIQSMCECIAADLKVDIGQVNVKATTTEKLGFEGRGEGIAVQAVALIQSK